jgi:peptidoglycan/LPS O-acetylase OafA/YrhL
LVLLFHQNLLQRSGVDTADARFFSQLAGVGWCGVNLFFVLSGFLITRILYGAKTHAGYS